jgi:transposase
MGLAKKRKYSEEFKLEAIRLLQNDPRPGATLARDLGVGRAMLYRWERELRMGKKRTRKVARPKKADGEALLADDNEVQRLRERVEQLEREKEILEQEKEILKKATAFFAKESR